ncbi:hypothetical protein [Halomicrococcus sp. NG-SE-24]|uniref:hypothetical protein n=1 Tax=Halomicrococcus sp. NG-SE-24 TaxID=3436928 RepID=UPI003D995FC1
MGEKVYDVYLVPSERGDGDRNIVSPVEGHEVEFYETGVWLAREGGRNFFPYAQIRTIREHSREAGETPTDEPGSDGSEE